MLDRHRVDAVRDRARRGWSIRSIVRALGVSRNTVRGYLRTRRTPGTQTRSGRRCLKDVAESELRSRLHDARGNASEVHRWLVESGVRVSVRTVQRAAAEVRCPRGDLPASQAPRRQPTPSPNADLELVRRIARRSRTHDRDELESELTEYLVLLERYRPTAKNWTAFLLDTLTKHAARWLGDQQRKRGTTASSQMAPSAGEGDTDDQGDVIRFVDPNLVDRVAVALARGSLDAWLARVWDAYIASGFNQTLTAIILGVHRNTVARALERIRQVLERHGF